MFDMVAKSGLIVALLMFPGQEPKEQVKSKTQPKAAASGAGSPKMGDKSKELSLDELLVQALKNNPDIRIAEAKLMEAEAELNRSRLATIQKAITLWNNRQNAKNALEEAEARLKTVVDLRKQNAAATEDLRGAQITVQRSKQELAAADAQMGALGGSVGLFLTRSSSTSAGSSSSSESNVTPFLEQLPRSVGQTTMQGEYLFALSQLAGQHANEKARTTAAQTLDAIVGAVNPQGPEVDKLRSALDKVVSIELQSASLEEALDTLRDKYLAPDLGIHKVLPESAPNYLVRLKLEKVALGAVFQAIEDSLSTTVMRELGENSGLRFAVRDYGLLVTTEALMPSGAVLLHDFWKGKKQSTAIKVSPHGLDASRAPMEGKITAVAVDKETVTVSLGSDAAVQVGQTLHLYRLKPEPVYLGTLLVEQVMPTSSVAKVQNRQAATKWGLLVGDTVSAALPNQ